MNKEPSLFPELPQPDTTVPPTPSRDGAPRLLVPQRNQIELRPVDLDATLAPEHPGRAVWAFVEGLDLSALYRDIGSVEGCAGCAAIDPRILYGESKLSTNVAWQFLPLLADKLVGKYVPVRFLAFAGIGMCWESACTSSRYRFCSRVWTSVSLRARRSRRPLPYSSTFPSTTSLPGPAIRSRDTRGLRFAVTFFFICGIGATANVGVASYLFGHDTARPLAALAGIVMSAGVELGRVGSLYMEGDLVKLQRRSNEFELHWATDS